MASTPRRSFLTLCATAALAATAAAQSPAPSNDDAAMARYRECLARLPFLYHTEGRTTLAARSTQEALATLIADYLGVKDHAEYARYTLADLFRQHFCDDPFVEPLRKLREAHKKPADTWLWYQTLAIEGQRQGTAALLDLVTTSKLAWQKAAAIAALGSLGKFDAFTAIEITCAAFPKKDKAADRALLLGAMAGVLADNRPRVRDPKARAGMTAYINLLQPAAELAPISALQVARHLMWALDGPGLMVTPEPWLVLLEHGKDKAKAPGSTVTQPRFFGIETEGERFCYVVDLSDSMCKEIDPDVIPRGPVTGPKKRPKGELPSSDDLPWHTIRTRFDLAREHLKLSLLRLPDDKYFSIVWFGTGAGTLPSSPGLVKATKANVQKAIKDLDAIVTGPPDPVTAPDGVLRGKTNLHAGLRHAFSLSARDYVASAAFVDAGVLTDGCDTIFLLSDGAPSWDEFFVNDKDYGEGQVVVDTEYQAGAARSPRLNYYGPYHDPQYLLADVQRMNAFRRVRLHCVGIGEANMDLLRRLAAIGHGELYTVGRAGPKPGAGGAPSPGGAGGEPRPGGGR